LGGIGKNDGQRKFYLKRKKIGTFSAEDEARVSKREMAAFVPKGISNNKRRGEIPGGVRKQIR